MNPILSKRLSRSLVAIVALAICAVPAVASAQPGPPDGSGKHAQAQRERKAKRARPRFPMEGAQFVSIVSNRIEKVEARIDRAIQRRNVPPAVKKQVKADLAQAKKAILGAAQRAAADGTVSKQEAQKVRQLAKRLRQQARQKYGKHARGKRGKGNRGPAHHGQRGPAASGRKGAPKRL